MKTIKNLTLDTLLIILSIIIPKKKGTYLLGAAHGMKLTGNPKYFYYYLLKQKDASVLWITENKNLFLQMRKKNFPVVYKYSIDAFLKILRSEFLIIEQMPKDITYYGQISLGRFTYIQTFHGIAIKKIGLDAGYEEKGIGGIHKFRFKKINHMLSALKTSVKKHLLYRYYDSIIVTSEQMKKISETAFNNKNNYILGYPRNDVLFSGTDELRQSKFNFEKYKKVICYIPTFRDNYQTVSPFSQNFFDDMNKVLAKKKWLFAIKKHPYEKAMIIPEGLSNIKDVSGEFNDVQELLLQTDVLITDYSSVANDFCLTGKPIIFYIYDMADYISNCRGFYYDYRKVFSGPFAENENDLLKYLIELDSWSKNKSYQQRYKKMSDFFNHHKDGLSSERLYQFLKNYK